MNWDVHMKLGIPYFFFRICHHDRDFVLTPSKYARKHGRRIGLERLDLLELLQLPSFLAHWIIRPFTNCILPPVRFYLFPLRTVGYELTSSVVSSTSTNPALRNLSFHWGTL